METNLTLYQLTDEMAAINNLFEENGGELTPELEERLTELNVALPSKIDAYNALMRKAEMTIEACKVEKKRLDALAKTASNTEENLKRNLVFAMTQHGITKIEGTLCKVSLRNTEAVDVYDEELVARKAKEMIAELQGQLPAWITLDYKINKTAIKDAIKAGTDVYGAQIVENTSAIIK